ncbi:hypothetical protein CDEST_02510 [Colletotrichum destructivum]|uniref:Uncharacterized protein n=1 Tax=Colletotrichum destructivum TaxID=34406 RepID=A0AAX4I292_9PEZI|nr:hypothetical protein CDEST_02510 [Colletotrichum destructivum]
MSGNKGQRAYELSAKGTISCHLDRIQVQAISWNIGLATHTDVVLYCTFLSPRWLSCYGYAPTLSVPSAHRRAATGVWKGSTVTGKSRLVRDGQYLLLAGRPDTRQIT